MRRFEGVIAQALELFDLCEAGRLPEVLNQIQWTALRGVMGEMRLRLARVTGLELARAAFGSKKDTDASG